jgi:hypothetical protein
MTSEHGAATREPLNKSTVPTRQPVVEGIGIRHASAADMPLKALVPAPVVSRTGRYARGNVGHGPSLNESIAFTGMFRRTPYLVAGHGGVVGSAAANRIRVCALAYFAD